MPGPGVTLVGAVMSAPGPKLLRSIVAAILTGGNGVGDGCAQVGARPASVRVLDIAGGADINDLLRAGCPLDHQVSLVGGFVVAVDGGVLGEAGHAQVDGKVVAGDGDRLGDGIIDQAQ